MKILIILLTIFSISWAIKAAVSPSQILLNTYGSQCPGVYDRYTSASIATIQSLNSVLNDLAHDPDCNGVNDLINASTRYTSLYNDFSSTNSSGLNRQMLEKQVALYTSMLSNPATPASQITYIQSQIVSNQAQIVSFKADESRFNSLYGVQARGANELVNSISNFLSRMDQTSLCYKKNGARISNLVSNALLTASAFSSAGTSLALASGAVITSSLGNYLENQHFLNSQIKLNDLSMPTAIRCVSAMLTENYCQTNDIKNLVDERIQSLEIPTEGQINLSGINLITNQLQGLSASLDEISAGSATSTQGVAITRSYVVKDETLLKQIRIWMNLYIENTRKDLLQISDPDQISSMVKNSIINMANIMAYPSDTAQDCINMASYYGCQVSSNHPIFKKIPFRLMPFELFQPGQFKSVPIDATTKNAISFENYFSATRFTLSDFEKVSLFVFNIIGDADSTLAVKKAQIISNDNYAIVVRANREFKGQLNAVSGLDKILENADRIILKLQNYPEGSERYSAQITDIKITKELALQTLNLLKEAIKPQHLTSEIMPALCQNKTLPTPSNFVELFKDSEFEIKSSIITSCLTKVLNLSEQGKEYLLSKVRNMVAYELEALMSHRELKESSLKIVNATKIDLVQSILNSFTNADTMSFEQLTTNLSTAKNNYLNTLNIFFDLFQDQITASLESNKISMEEKRDLCFRTLPYLANLKDNPDNQKTDFIKSIYNNCRAFKLKQYKHGSEINFSDFILEKPASKRWGEYDLDQKYELTKNSTEENLFCSLKNYHLSNLLFEQQIKK